MTDFCDYCDRDADILFNIHLEKWDPNDMKYKHDYTTAYRKCIASFFMSSSNDIKKFEAEVKE